ncbi:hypothetical protein BJ742DRAFT_871137 [Cladochytrium replicatum]|nr:hypothetical protein BJ742DRAFT_871137 [Cladochytrium replicatum]
MPKRKQTASTDSKDATTSSPSAPATKSKVSKPNPTPRAFIAEKATRHAMYATLASRGQFFVIEYSNSNRSKCRGCSKLIPLNELRLRHVVCGRQCCTQKKSGRADTCGRWHLQCLKTKQDEDPERFVYTNADWTPVLRGEQLLGFEDIKEEDREVIRKIFDGEKRGCAKAEDYEFGEEPMVKRLKAEDEEKTPY